MRRYKLVKQFSDTLLERNAVLLEPPDLSVRLVVLIQPSHLDGYTPIDEKIRRDPAVRLMDDLPKIKRLQVSLSYSFIVVHAFEPESSTVKICGSCPGYSSDMYTPCA